jgi:peptide/nickel transport system substrate-binding protein
MKRLFRSFSLFVFATTVIVGCAPGAQPGGGGPGAANQQAQPKRLIIASREAPAALIDVAGSGGDVIEELTSAGLVRFTPVGEPVALLAEAVPGIDNGLLKVFPDGRMETTWTLKPGVKWHDGTPLTTEDLVFTVRVGQEGAVPELGHDAYRALNSVRAVDERTIVAEWKRVYIQADRLFSWRVGLPLPKHVLEESYNNQRETFIQNRYWLSNEFIHAGPYRVKEFVAAERLVATANPDFVLGRPKVDEIEVRSIPDGGAFVANLLSGDVHFSIGSAVTMGQAKQAAEQWPNGKLATYPIQSVKTAAPQLLNPDPPVLLDVRFRRALAHAFDKDALNELINQGIAPPLGAFMVPVGAPEYEAIKPSLVEYKFDPRRAAQLIDEIGGFTKSGDTYRDASGKDLSVHFLTVNGGAEEQSALFLADSWRRLGVKTELDLRAQLERDQRAQRPGFTDGTGTFMMTDPDRLIWLHSESIPTAENRFRGNNRARYSNPELDSLIDRFFATVSPQDRVGLMAQIGHIVTDQVTQIPAYHTMHVALINNRAKNVTPRTGLAQAWDSHLWDIE